MRIQLCDPCLSKLKEAASQGGKAGSRQSKIHASRLGVKARRDKSNLIVFDGRSLHVAEWAKLTGLSKQTIWRRLRKKLPMSKVLAVHGSEHLPPI
jgi:hypothetical protein